MTLTELTLLGLATWQAIEIWHHGAIFVEARAYWQNEPYGPWLTQLVLCPFCLSVWVAGALLLISLTPYLGWFVVGTLAVSRLANLANDVSHSVCRTPNRTPPD